MTSDISQSGYLFYLNLIKLLDERQSHAALDLNANEMRLLELIALDHLNLSPFSMSGLTEIQSIGSVETVQENIRLLTELGLIEQFFIGANKSTMYLKPSKLAIEYFSNVGLSMFKAMESDFKFAP